MSEPNARALRPGHRIALGQDVYTVIQLNGTTITLQDQHGELSATLLGYLLTAPDFTALDAAPPKRVPQDGRIFILDDKEQRRIRWLEGHLIELETGRHPEGPTREAYDPDLHSMEERELAKLAEFKAAGAEMTQRHLQRLRQAYRADGLIGLADKRALRSLTPFASVDPRVIAAIEEMLADPRGRSTVARSVMLTQVRRKLDETHGLGEVPMPSRATFYRLMNSMDRGRRNFVSEASRQGEGARGDWQPAHYGRFFGIWNEYQKLREQDPSFEPARPVIPAFTQQPFDIDQPQPTEPVTREVAELFNLGYEVLLQVLTRFFTHTDESDEQLDVLAHAAFGIMGGVLKPLGNALTRLPVGADNPGCTAGPAFQMFYQMGNFVPWREAAWVLLSERAAVLSRQCAGCAAGAGVPGAVSAAAAAAARIAEQLAGHVPHDLRPA